MQKNDLVSSQPRRSVSLLIIGILVIGILLIGGLFVWGSQDSAVEVILHNRAIKLYRPFEIKDVIYYRDGGTIGIVITDSKGETLPFCLDGRLQEVEFGKAIKPYHIYIGAVHPDSPEAQKLPIGGKGEKSILEILQSWIEEGLSKQEYERLLNTAGIIGLSKKELNAYRVLRVIKTLENR